ncbi:MAG: TerB family tellurite resistance protein [Myxococcota bacterium]
MVLPSSPLATALDRVLLAMIIVDDDVDPDEVATAETAYADAVGNPAEPGAFARAAAEAKAAGKAPAQLLEDLPQLDETAQRAVLGAAFAVAGADGFVLEEEDALLQDIGRALGMDDGEVRSTLAALMA